MSNELSKAIKRKTDAQFRTMGEDQTPGVVETAGGTVVINDPSAYMIPYVAGKNVIIGASGSNKVINAIMNLIPGGNIEISEADPITGAVTISVPAQEVDLTDVIIDCGLAGEHYLGGVYGPIEDTFTYQDTPNGTRGLSTRIDTSGYSSYFMRAYLKFDLSDIPPGTVIKSAKLYLYKTYINTYGQDLQYSIRRILEPWDHLLLTYANAPGYSSRYGPIYTFGAINAWSVHDVVDMVQEWVDGVYPNHGMCTTYENTGWRINSGWASMEYPDAIYRPYLEIEV